MYSNSNNNYNQGANISVGENVAGQLYQYSLNGGGYTQLQRDATSREGFAGQSIVNQQLITNGIDTLVDSVNTGTQIYTGEKARKYKINMLNTLQDTEQKLVNVSDPTQHQQIYNETISKLQTDLSSAGIMQTKDLDEFNIILSEQKSIYYRANNALKIKKVGTDIENEISATINYMDSTKGSFDQHEGLIKNTHNSIVSSLMESGVYSLEDAQKKANEYQKLLILSGANSKANPKMIEDYAINIHEKNDNGEFKYFPNINGTARQLLGEQLKSTASKDNAGNIRLEYAFGRTVPNSRILDNPFFDNDTKAELLRTNNALSNQNKKDSEDSFLEGVINSHSGYMTPRGEFEKFLGSDQFKQQTSYLGLDPAIVSSKIREKFDQRRDAYEKDPIKVLLEDKNYDYLPRDKLINIQKQSLNPNQIQVLSSAENDQFTSILNNVKTPEDKIRVANFTHETSQGILTSLKIDPTQQKQFIEKYQADILRNAKTVYPEDKLALDCIAKKCDPIFTRQMFQISIDREQKGGYADVNEDYSKTAFTKGSEYLKYLGKVYGPSSYEYKTVQVAGNHWAKSQFAVGDSSPATTFDDALKVGIIDNSNMLIKYNTESFNKKNIQNTLRSMQLNYDKNKDFLLNSLPGGASETMSMLDNKQIRKIKDNGKWISDGDGGFALIANFDGREAMVGYVKLRESNGKQSLDLPTMQTQVDFNALNSLKNNN